MNICTQLFDFIWCRCSHSFLQHFFSAISLLFIGKLPVIVLPAGASTASVFIPIFSLHNFNSIAKMLQFFPLALYCSYLLACTMHFWFSPFDGKFMRCIRLILRCECVSVRSLAVVVISIFIVKASSYDYIAFHFTICTYLGREVPSMNNEILIRWQNCHK